MAEKEYIEREYVLETLEDLYDHHLTMGNYSADSATQDCINAVVEAPACDVVEVKHGKWVEIDNKVIEHGLVERKGKTWKCTNCGEARKTRTNPDMNYCPNCGAKMKGGA